MAETAESGTRSRVHLGTTTDLAAMRETVVARGLPARLRANGFGVLGLTQSLGDLVATVVVGVLWSLVSPTVAFCYAAAWMLASVAASGLLRPQEPAKT